MLHQSINIVFQIIWICSQLMIQTSEFSVKFSNTVLRYRNVKTINGFTFSILQYLKFNKFINFTNIIKVNSESSLLNYTLIKNRENYNKIVNVYQIYILNLKWEDLKTQFSQLYNCFVVFHNCNYYNYKILSFVHL